MWELVKAGGWLMLPLILSSIFTVAITIERYIRLKRSQVLPRDLFVNGSNAETVISNLQQEQAKKSPLDVFYLLDTNTKNRVNNLRVRKWRRQLHKKFHS